mmetsp:Transcript_48908/g.87893  ORF Transcript_48908/g.87893 Transcript_48908/m.87893 type:complete len:316 (+) Transcript_48908:1-948(+)
MKVVPSLRTPGVKVGFQDALEERGYECLRFHHELLVCWLESDFEKPLFTSKEVQFDYPSELGAPHNLCIAGRNGAAACNVCFSELITRLPKGAKLDSEIQGTLEDLSRRAPHDASMIRLRHQATRSMVVMATVHLQTPSTDFTGEMRSNELNQLRRELHRFTQEEDYLIIGGDFNINLAPEKPRAPYERYIFEGTFPARSAVLQAIKQTNFQTGFSLRKYGNVTGVSYHLGRRELVDVAGAEDQGGCVTSKASGRAMMIDYIFADTRLTSGLRHGGVCMQHKPSLEPPAIPDVNDTEPVEFSDHFAITALLYLPA